jgi:hypothetical protein
MENPESNVIETPPTPTTPAGRCSLDRPVRNYEYEIVAGEWVFNRDGEQLKSASVAIIYDKGEPYDVLLKHGETKRVRSVFLSDAYSKMYKMGCDLRFVEIPIVAVEMLNKCLSISASRWCSKLEDYISANVSDHRHQPGASVETKSNL